MGLEAGDDPQSIFLDVTGLAPLYGGEERLVREVQSQLAARGRPARLALADTLGTAWAVAHYANLEGCRVLSKAERPWIVAPGGNAEALARLPLAALRLPEATLALLRQLGLDRIAQLAAVPRGEWALRFGAELLVRWDQALGLMPEPLPSLPPLPELKVSEVFDFPLTRTELVEASLGRMIRQLGDELREFGLGVLELRCTLRCLDRPPVELSVGLFQPATTEKHLLPLVRMRLEQTRLPSAVGGVSVEAAATAPLVGRQHALFADMDTAQNSGPLTDLIDRLSNRLGCQAVARAELTPEAQPELACVLRPWIDQRRGAGRRGRKAEALGDRPGVRPLRLMTRPRPLEMMAVSPHGPPLQFRWQGCSHQVRWSWGPERIETGWWRGQPIARDYYRVETNGGLRFWVYRRFVAAHESGVAAAGVAPSAQGERWFLHGMFD